MYELWLYSPYESTGRYSNLFTVWRKNDSALISKRKTKCSETSPGCFDRPRILWEQAKRNGRYVWWISPDDWGGEYDIALYEETYDEAIRFATEFSDTAWCYGNHDLSYFWHCLESGYSPMASETVQRKLLELRRTVPEDNPICYVQKIDNVLFSHGAILDRYSYPFTCETFQ